MVSKSSQWTCINFYTALKKGFFVNQHEWLNLPNEKKNEMSEWEGKSPTPDSFTTLTHYSNTISGSQRFMSTNKRSVKKSISYIFKCIGNLEEKE